MANNKILGKGLSALISENKLDFLTNKSEITRDSIDIKLLTVGRYQPRREFNEKNLQELADSISKNGIISPIIVREINNERYEIIAGERRWRASKIAGLAKVPVIIRKLTDQEALEFAIIENIQRQDLNAIEEATGYQRLIDEFRYTQEQLSHALGKSRSHIANFLRILSLPDSIKDKITSGSLSMGHAKAIASCDSPEEVVENIIKNKLTVRQTEKIVKGNIPIQPKQNNFVKSQPAIRSFDTPKSYIQDNIYASAEKNINADLVQIEDSLSNSIGYKVSIEQREGQNKIVIHFNTIEQLDNILQKLSRI